jgi:hypothetical protein
MTFDRTDLTADISEKELAGIADKLVVLGDPDPVETTIVEQQAKLERYIHFYVVDDDWQKTLLRALVLWEIYKRLGSIPAKRQTAYDEAMKTLREIRDGKFKTLPLRDPVPTDVSAGRGASGSETRYQDR